MEEIKKEVERLQRKTSYLHFLILVILINIVFFTATQLRQYCKIMEYYEQTIELNDDLTQILQDTNQLQEEILSKIQ